MSLWRGGPIEINPYERTAFHVARVPREQTVRATLLQIAKQTQNLVRADPGAHEIAGEPVTLGQINAAKARLLDPEQRLIEELLYHATERPPTDAVRRLLEECRESLSNPRAGPPNPPNTRAFESLLGRILRECFDGTGEAGPSFGACELNLEPPFGPVERTSHG